VSTPRVTVVAAVHNGAEWIEAAVESVLSQDFRDLEFIVVDDGSTDRTAEILQSVNDLRLVYVRNERNLGQTASLNVGVRRARASLIARIDADDLWLPGKLSRQMAYLDAHPEVSVLGTWATRMDVAGQPLGPADQPVSPTEVRTTLLRTVPVCHGSVVMRRDAVLAVGGYEERFRFAADYALWSALARAGCVITSLPERLTACREHAATFGAAHKVGAAGDESAEIIRANAMAFAGISLTAEESRAIALLFFPQANLELTAIVRATDNLRRLYAAVGGVPRFRSSVALWATLVWAVSKRWSGARPADRSVLRECVTFVTGYFLRRRFLVAAAGATAGLASILGDRRLMRVKSHLAPHLVERSG
jgi:hypothetical protein